ncbi:MAG TPA: bifunctional precorrin-2 dehydrogenase/sirohydrochlorin ferrochelatase, partial [Methylomirabilota bacterium]|nr:bifunctional precorrin-2 dehydrogenase/sirohydrochlorin ferrochelatase [Methylomirabilota bacterium]
MPRYYPAFLDLHEKLVVVVGGGEVAERKVELLLSCRAAVKVISPILTPRLTRLRGERAIQVELRPFQPDDCAGAFLVFACTDDPAVNERVAKEAQQTRALVNVADMPPLCDFIAPSVVSRGDLLIAISTGGASPALAKRLRREIEQHVGPEYEELARLCEDVRKQVQARVS